MSHSSKMVDFLIVGAGLTGLMAARFLRERGRVLLLEKESCVGGRMVTQEIGPGLADLGAQFFTVRSADFSALCQEWLSDEIVTPWATGWSDASLAPITQETHPRYIAKGGMVALANHLAQGLTVQTGVELEAILPLAGGWQARSTGGQVVQSRALLLTPPAPQTLALLTAGDVPLSRQDRAALEAIAFAPSLVSVFRLSASPRLPGLGVVQLPQGSIRFLVDNKRKGISPGAATLTAQASAEYSRQQWDRPDEAILKEFATQIQPYLEPGSTIQESLLRRWPYAVATSMHPEQFLQPAGLSSLFVAGDGFGLLGGIEGAALSGVAAGRAMAHLYDTDQ